MITPDKQFALLIDGDNAQASLIPEILKSLSKYGDPIIRRMYGDWTKQQMSSWKSLSNTYSIQPVQQFSYTTGKNSTDSALIIDAMDILYTTDVTGFCIVSSDSDYTRLATRIRENNLFVLGIGRKTTPVSFKNACNEFIFTESLKTPKKAKKKKKKTKMSQQLQNMSKADRKILTLLQKAFDISAKTQGWVHLGALGKSINEVNPKFSYKDQGYSRLSTLLEAYPKFVEVRKDGTVHYVRLR